MSLRLLTVSLLTLSTAYADGAAGGFDPMQFAPIVLIFVVFYFLIMRPQQKKLKKHQEMLKNLQRGNKIVTNGGLVGTVSKVISDSELEVEIAADVKVRVMRSMVNDLFSKPEPVNVVKNNATEKKAGRKPASSTKRTTTNKKAASSKTAANNK